MVNDCLQNHQMDLKTSQIHVLSQSQSLDSK